MASEVNFDAPTVVYLTDRIHFQSGRLGLIRMELRSPIQPS